jgi:hypothetical protein
MAWERRGHGLYYYQSEHGNGRVRKRYMGRGEVAEIVAHANETIRHRREAKAEREREDLELARTLASSGEQMDEAAEILAKAEMVAAGYHNHKGEWRRRRSNA